MTTTILVLAAALKVLAIGNSFSASLLDDFGEVAKAAGVELDFAACTIGGSSMERHVREMRIADTNTAYFGCWGGWSYASEGYPTVPSCWKDVVRLVGNDRTVEKRVFAPNHFRPESQEAKEVVCVFAAAELPSVPFDVEVRPAAFFGKEGPGLRMKEEKVQ